MPRTAIDYTNTIIYKIQHSENDELIYVGHTTDFTKRKSNHKANCNREKNTHYKYKVYQMIRENGGWDMFRMTEIKAFSCNNKREAEAEEDKLMRELKATMNRHRSFLIQEEIAQYRAEWKERNKEAVKEYNRQRYIKIKNEIEILKQNTL